MCLLHLIMILVSSRVYFMPKYASLEHACRKKMKQLPWLILCLVTILTGIGYTKLTVASPSSLFSKKRRACTESGSYSKSARPLFQSVSFSVATPMIIRGILLISNPGSNDGARFSISFFNRKGSVRFRIHDLP